MPVKVSVSLQSLAELSSLGFRHCPEHITGYHLNTANEGRRMAGLAVVGLTLTWHTRRKLMQQRETIERPTFHNRRGTLLGAQVRRAI